MRPAKPKQPTLPVEDMELEDVISTIPTRSELDIRAAERPAPPEPDDDPLWIILHKADLAVGAVQRRLDEALDLGWEQARYKFCMDQCKAALSALRESMADVKKGGGR